MMDPNLLRPRDVDRLLGLPRGRALKLCASGLMPHVEIPSPNKQSPEIRIRRGQLDAWLAAGCPAERMDRADTQPKAKPDSIGESPC